MEKRALVKREIAKYLLYVALFLLLFVTFNLLIATVLFIFRISVQPWYVIMAGVLSILAVAFMMKKRRFLNGKSVAIVIVVPLLTITGLTVLNGKIYDSTYDGNNYHKLAIGLMMEGWNPLYETEAEFVESSMEEPINLNGWAFWWGDAYAKASYIFAANIGSLTGSVESGKVLNDISVVIVFCMFLGVLIYTGKSWTFAMFFAFLAVTPTTIGSQLLTNYVDILVYLYVFLLAGLFFWFEYAKEYQEELLLLFFMTLVMLINVKFSAFAYAGFLCAVYYGWYIYRYRKEHDFDKRFFKRFTWTAIVALVIGVFVVGLSTYPRNVVVYGHPLYPLMGENKKDIMTINQPVYFKDKSNFEKFLIGTFSKMDNINEVAGREAEWKVPFSVHKDELQWYGYHDLRISGNGIFFGGILIVSFIVVAVGAMGLYRKDKKLFMMIMLPVVMTLVMILFMPETWWARYFPQSYFIVFAALLMLKVQDWKVARWLLYAITGLVLANNVPYDVVAVRDSIDFSFETRAMMYDFRELNPVDECSKLVIATTNFPGAYFNGREALKGYEKIKYDVYEKEELSQYLYLMVPYLVGRCEK